MTALTMQIGPFINSLKQAAAGPVFICAMVLFSFSNTLSAGQMKLIAADIHAADYPTVRGLRAMAEQLAEESDNALKMKIYSGGQLGDEKDMLEITLFGGIDISRTSLAPLNSVVPETGVFSLPFLFRSTEHMRRVLDGPIGDEMLGYLEPHGLIGLAFYDAGARNMYNTLRPIKEPKDMAGMKVRVMNSEIFVDMIAAIGGNATPMSFGQVYESLALGTIDGAENNWPSFESSRHFEVASHYSVTQHVMVPEIIVMSRHRWERLSPKEQKLVRKSAKNSVKVMREFWDARVQKSRSAIIAAGVNVIENVDKKPFIDAMNPLYDNYLKDPKLLDLVERIRATN